MTMMECLNEINDVLETDYDDIRELFPEKELLKEEEDEHAEKKKLTRLRSGRIAKKPRVVTRAKWDVESFPSDTEDDSFESDSSGSSSESESDDYDDDEDLGIILDFKREHKKVDYLSLAKEMFGDSSPLDEEDGDFLEGHQKNQLDNNVSLSELVSNSKMKKTK